MRRAMMTYLPAAAIPGIAATGLNLIGSTYPKGIIKDSLKDIGNYARTGFNELKDKLRRK
jgi:hypothetical protein